MRILTSQHQHQFFSVINNLIVIQVNSTMTNYTIIKSLLDGHLLTMLFHTHLNLNCTVRTESVLITEVSFSHFVPNEPSLGAIAATLLNIYCREVLRRRHFISAIVHTCSPWCHLLQQHLMLYHNNRHAVESQQHWSTIST